MTTIDWYPDEDGDMACDDPWMSVYFDSDEGWSWAAWANDGKAIAWGDHQGDCDAAMRAAERWWDAQRTPDLGS